MTGTQRTRDILGRDDNIRQWAKTGRKHVKRRKAVYLRLKAASAIISASAYLIGETHRQLSRW